MNIYLTNSFAYYLVIFGAVMPIIWMVCRLLQVKSPGIPVFGAVFTALILSPFHPVVLAISAIPFVIGFRVGRSTKVALDPTDAFSQRVKLSDEEYAVRIENINEAIMSARGQEYFHSPYVSPTNKLTLLFEGNNLYSLSRGVATTYSLLYFPIFSTAVYPGGTGFTFILFLLSFPYGYSIGMLWKYMKGNRVRPIFMR